MPGSNNFLQWNPAAVNQQTDGTYSADTMRTGGAVTGIFPADLANKLFYQCSTMVAAFGEALSNKGYTVSDANIATLITLLANVLTKADFGTTAGSVCQGNDSRLNTEVPSGSKVWFYQNTAPSGWVIDATPADAILAVKGGSAAYNTTGGTQAGTWTQPTHLHTTGDHTLSAAESGLPAHTHDYTINYYNKEFISSDNWYALFGRQTTGTTSANVAANASQAHNHGNTGSSNTANTWRPLAQVGIICTKS